VPVYNADVARSFNQVADLLEIEGANQYRVRAYRSAARTISTLSRSVVDMVEQGEDLTELSSIGEDLAGKIEEIVNTGHLKQLEEIEQRTPRSWRICWTSQAWDRSAFRPSTKSWASRPWRA
jgi:DNA polymerase (family 10)